MTTTPSWLEADLGIEGVHIRVTTRAGGVSQPPWSSQNLGDHVGDLAGHVTENRQRLQDALPIRCINWLRQEHGTLAVQAVDDKVPTADAQWTQDAGRALAVLTADCLPVVLIARDAGCIGIAHAGWRGLAAGVLESLLAEMPVNPATLVAWFGPAISQRAYEVGPAVKEAFRGVLGDSSANCFAPSMRQEGHWMADLCALARLHLARAGVPEILGGGQCTHSEADQFFSYRRDGDPTGRMATLIWRS